MIQECVAQLMLQSTSGISLRLQQQRGQINHIASLQSSSQDLLRMMRALKCEHPAIEALPIRTNNNFHLTYKLEVESLLDFLDKPIRLAILRVGNEIGSPWPFIGPLRCILDRTRYRLG